MPLNLDEHRSHSFCARRQKRRLLPDLIGKNLSLLATLILIIDRGAKLVLRSS